MQLRYRYRLYPSGQRQTLTRAFRCTRVIYNDAVATRRNAYQAEEKFPTGAALQKRLITHAKKTHERAWLGEVPNILLQLRYGVQEFFDAIKGKRVGKQVGTPRFKFRKDNRQAIRLYFGGFPFCPSGRLRLTKIGDVSVRWSRGLPSPLSSVTINKTADGRYYASFVVEVGNEALAPAVDEYSNDIETGFDLGLLAFAVDQYGRKITNSRLLRRTERRLKRLQRAVSRKQKDSNNRDKVRRSLARQHAKVCDIRVDWLHKETTRLVRENQAVYLEDLAVSGLAKAQPARSVHDASWGAFRSLLAEKAARYGRTLAAIDQWRPTSQTCFECGRIDGKQFLSVREWTCLCGMVHDRDVNAARNILAAGRRGETPVDPT